MTNIDDQNEVVNSLELLPDFKWWRLQNELPAALLKEIIFRWRGSNAKVDGDPAPWVAYPHRRWRVWMGGISESSFERALKKLVQAGLLERERHRFAGTTTCAFLRPTATALKHLGRPGDEVRLSVNKPKTKALKSKAFDGSVDGTHDGTGDGTLDGSDYTSFPSFSNHSSNSTKSEACLEPGKGKEKSGEEKKGKVKVIHIPAKVTTAPAPIDPDDLEFSAAWEKLQAAKAKNQNKLFPELKGAHQKAVKHPSHNPKWPSLSQKVQAELYEKYQTYVANWYKGKQGKPYADNDVSDEEFMALVTYLKEEADAD